MVSSVSIEMTECGFIDIGKWKDVVIQYNVEQGKGDDDDAAKRVNL